jgi:hypothetical protein
MTEEEPETPAADDEQAQIQAQIVDLEEKWRVLTEANGAEIAAIAQMGATLGADSVTRARMDVFIGFIFARLGATSPEIRRLLMMQFEVEFEERIGSMLTQVKGEIRKAILSSGSAASKEDLAKMWRQQNGNRQGGPGGTFPG